MTKRELYPTTILDTLIPATFEEDPLQKKNEKEADKEFDFETDAIFCRG